MSSPTDIRFSFNEVADSYDRALISPQLFDALFQLLPRRRRLWRSDPETGKATETSLSAEHRSTRLRSVQQLAGKLRSSLPSDHRLRVTVGDFEDVSIASNTADAVFSATAYEWVSQAAQTDRPATIL